MLPMQQKTYDVAVIGAGIVGLATALQAAKKGLKVAVFERHPKAVGASIRNFGMIWPIGQPAGKLLDRALRSRGIWLELATHAGYWTNESGSLHLAYHDDEMAVLEEFVKMNADAPYQCILLSPQQVLARSKFVNEKGLKGALWSSTEVNVDPRQAIWALAAYLEKCYSIDFYFNTVVTAIDFPHLMAYTRLFKIVEHIFVCSGADFETLYPSLMAKSGLTKCKLQMMSSQPQDLPLGPMLCAGLTLRHYSAFENCPSLAATSERFDREAPWFKEYGIHVLLSQNVNGQLIIGDSHEYGLHQLPFDKAQVNAWILEYLKRFTQIPSLEIAETWHGIYPKSTTGATEFVESPAPNVTVINGLGGAGMTLSFGLAEEVLADY
jgi:D-hydroxyproline dehydrogenase subunit beta